MSQFLGFAELVEHDHASGVRVRSWDLAQFGGPRVFMGPVTQELPSGTLDRGDLRLSPLKGEVWRIEAGDPLPSIGAPGVVLAFWPFLFVTGIAWILGSAARKR